MKKTIRQKLHDVALRSISFSGVAVLAFASVLTVVLSNHASAGQITSRKIEMATTKTSATTVQYVATFTTATTGNVQGVVIDFCSNSPLTGLSCTAPTTFTNGSPSMANSGFSGTWTSGTLNSGRTLTYTNASGGSVTAPQIVTLTWSTVTNPSAVGTFYARILTYATSAAALAYTDTTPGAYVDGGGIALSTANQLTVNARVQEQLAFCVGGTTVNDGTTSVSTDCSVAFTGSGTCGNTVDLGVVDNAASKVSPVTTGNGGDGCNGAAMVRTNASNGVVVSYFPEAGTGTNHTRSLRVSGATCDANATIPSTVNTDQCFNSSGSTQNTLVAGTEEFGMTVAAINPASTTSYTCTFAGNNCNLVRDTNYDGTGGATFPTDTNSVAGTSNAGYAWSETAATETLVSSASSSIKVVDDEALILKFGATANITTPTGAYAVTSTYIATATF